MMRVLTIALLVLIVPLLARGDTPRPRPLVAGEVLRGRFVQERHLRGFAAPLRSEGHFVVVAGAGLVWRGEVPLATTVVITPRGILQVIDESQTVRLPASRIPIVARLFDMMSGALSGDLSAMERDFIAERSADAEGWRLMLKPRAAGDPAMPIESIALKGRSFVDEVEIRKAGGDSERLNFLDQTVTPGPLDAEEAKLLAAAAQ
jgi:hypothetical protein